MSRPKKNTDTVKTVEETKEKEVVVEEVKAVEDTPTPDTVDDTATEPVVEEVKEKIDPMVEAMLKMRAKQAKKEADKQADIYSAMSKILSSEG